MGTIIAAIIGAAVAVGMGIYGSNVNSKLTKTANAKSEELWNIQRADDLKWKKSQKDIAEVSARQKKREFDWQKQQAKLARGERAEVRGYERRQNEFNKALGLVNQTQANRNNFFNIWDRAQRKAA